MHALAVLAAIGALSFMGVCLLGGGRLVLLASRTRGLPELVLGSGLFLMGGIATPLGALSKAPIGLEASTRIWFYVIQIVIVAVGVGGIGVFTWRVFHPAEKWAAGFAVAIPAVTLGLLMFIGATTGFQRALDGTGWAVHAMGCSIFVGLAWAAFESTRYARALAKRVKLGLAEPQVWDRVRLWGVAMGLASAMSGISVGCAIFGIDLLANPAGGALIGNLGGVAGIAIYLAFLPPESYKRWVVRRAAAA